MAEATEVKEEVVEKEVKEVVDESTDDDNENYGGFEQDDALVKLAEKRGWLPKDKLNNPDKWVPPDKYIDAQWDINDATKNSNKRLERTVEQLGKKLDQVTRHYEDMSKREQGKAQGELKDMWKQAVEEGDADKAEQIQAQIDDLKKPPAQRDAASADPAITEWMEGNIWYRPEGKGAPDDVQEIIELVEELNNLPEYGALSPKFRLAKIDREVASYVEMRRPDLIGRYHFSGIKPASVDGKAAPRDDDIDDTKTRRQISDVEGNASRGKSSRGLTYNSLSETEKRMCDSAVASIEGYTREEWVTEYAKTKNVN